MKISSAILGLLLVLFYGMLQAQPPVNYYDAATGKSCGELKTALKNIISVSTAHTYDQLWGQFTVSDVKTREVGTGSAKVIYDLYSDKPGPNNDPYNFTPGAGSAGQQDNGLGGNAEGQYYNREHVVPLSWFNGNTGSTGTATDYQFIFPVDKSLNNRRQNFPYGKVGNATFISLNGSKLGTSSVSGISGTVFEPVDSFKGDIARTFLYFITRYENSMPVFGNNADAIQAFEPNTFPSADIPYLGLMISWHNLDPVSAKEISRNNAAYAYQGNRNPYIDHPEYVDFVWNNTCTGLITLPVDIVSFDGKLTEGRVKLEWTVANETDLQRYEVERSFNGTEFSKIGQVPAIGLHSYIFSDYAAEKQSEKVYYRLKKINKDGRFGYSAVFTLSLPSINQFSVFPNPATTFIQLQMYHIFNGKATIQLTDLSGKSLQQKTQVATGGNIYFSTAGISAGIYLVKVIYAGQQYVQKVILIK